MKRKTQLLLPVLLLIWYTASSQWVSDPLVNTQLSFTEGEQNLPKVAVCEDGNMYISWFSMENGNYNMRLQYLDKDGNAQWEENGLLISAHPQMSWLTDYDLEVDITGNALLTFQDIRSNDNNNPVAYCISSAGEFLWGDNGIMLADNANFDVNPVVCCTDEGNAVFAWISSTDSGYQIGLQKIAPEGQLLWGDGIILSSADETYNYPYLEPFEGDQVYLVWHKETGPFWSPNRGLYVQLLNGDGSFAWENDAEVYPPVASGPVVNLDMCSDGMGGLAFSWYISSNLHFHAYLQHMDNQGNMSMGDGGTLASTTTARNHMYPSITFLDMSQEIVVCFSEQDLNQNQRGIYVQKVDLEGNRQWGDEGIAIIPLSDNDYSQISASSFQDKTICIYEAYEFGNGSESKIQSFMLDATGSMVWEDQFVDLCTYPAEKIHPEITDYFWGQWVCVWEGKRNENCDIYAQNIQPDGSLGAVITGISKQKTGNELMEVWPNPCSDQLHILIENIPSEVYSLTIFDQTGKIIKKTTMLNSSYNTVDLDLLVPGFYIFRVEAKGSVFHGRFIKE